jgi:hypothetical protein
MVGVGCDLALLKALMRPDLVVEARGTQDVVAAQRSPTESKVLDGGLRKACTGRGAGSVGRVGAPVPPFPDGPSSTLGRPIPRPPTSPGSNFKAKPPRFSLVLPSKSGTRHKQGSGFCTCPRNPSSTYPGRALAES